MSRTIIMTDTGPIGLVRPDPERAEVTENELAWIGFLREISDRSDPPPKLAAAQPLRLALRNRSWPR